MAAVKEIIFRIRPKTKEAEKALKDLTKNTDEFSTSLGKAGKQTTFFGKQIKQVGGIIAGAFAVDRLISFGQEAFRLAKQAQGIEAAFKRLDNPTLLNDLRKATKGTVSDLELMQKAVQARNFDIPLEQLAKLFQFASQRARETGESVDFLVNSIVLGIGRKSPLILDNLGISAVRLRKELKGVGTETATVGDIAAAVGQIIDQEMNPAVANFITQADRIDQVTAKFANMQKVVGEGLLEAADKGLLLLLDLIEGQMPGVNAAMAEGAKIVAEIGEEVAAFSKEIEGIKTLAELEELQKKVNFQLDLATTKYGDNSKEVDIVKGKLDVLAFAIKNFEPEVAKAAERTELFKDELEKLATIEERVTMSFKRMNAELQVLKEEFDFQEANLPDALQPREVVEATSTVTGEFSKLEIALSKAQIFFHENQEAIQEWGETIQTAASIGTDAINNQVRAIDGQIRAQERRVDKATELAKEGNTEALKAEEDRLRKLEAQRESFLRRQQILSSIEFATNIALAVSKTAAQSGAAAPVTIPITLAALAGGLAVGLGLFTPQGFADGTEMVTGGGSEKSDSVPAMLSRGERVITAKKNKEYWNALSAIHNGTIPAKELNDFVTNYTFERKPFTNQIVAINGNKGTEQKLDEIANILKRQGKSTFNIDENGIHAVVDRINMKNNRMRKYLA